MSVFTKIKNRTKRAFLFVKDFFYRTTHRQPKVMTIEKTLDYILENKCSVARYGDGELKLAYFENSKLYFQSYDERLSQKLRDGITLNNDKVLICLPDIFGLLKRFKKDSKIFWQNYMFENRSGMLGKIPTNRTYGNAFITRPYNDLKDKSKSGIYFDKLKRIWENKKVLIVEGEKSRLGTGNDLFLKCEIVERVLCPIDNAFKKYDEIISFVESEEKYKDYLILIALGPTATAMAIDLSEKGLWAIDIGHIDIEYEWFNLKTDHKVAIKGKYCGEAPDGKEVEDSTDEKYLSQIVKKIL